MRLTEWKESRLEELDRAAVAQYNDLLRRLEQWSKLERLIADQGKPTTPTNGNT